MVFKAFLINGTVFVQQIFYVPLHVPVSRIVSQGNYVTKDDENIGLKDGDIITHIGTRALEDQNDINIAIRVTPTESGPPNKDHFCVKILREFNLRDYELKEVTVQNAKDLKIPPKLEPPGEKSQLTVKISQLLEYNLSISSLKVFLRFEDCVH